MPSVVPYRPMSPFLRPPAWNEYKAQISATVTALNTPSPSNSSSSSSSSHQDDLLDTSTTLTISPAQLAMLAQNHNFVAYQIPLPAKPSIDRLSATWQALSAHHPVLRAMFTNLGDENNATVQLILKRITPLILFPNSSDIPTRPTPAYAVYSNAGFFIHIHPALIDAHSVDILRADFHSFYEGYAFESQTPFSSFVERLSKRNVASSLEFWRNQFAGYHAPSLLGPATDSQKADKKATVLALNANFENNYDVSPYSFIMAAWAFVLSRHLETQEVVFSVAHRETEANDVVGFVEVTFPIRVQVRTGTFLKLVRAVELMAEKGAKEAFMGRSKIQEILNFSPETSIRIGDSITEDIAPLDIRVVESRLEAHYEGLEEDRVNSMLKHFVKVVKDAIARPYECIEQFTMADAAELKSLVNFGTRRRVDPQTLHSLFEEQALRTPNEPAVQYETAPSLTYAELNRKADRVASQLITGMNGQTGQIVPLFMEASVEMVIAMLAILKAGAAFVILDPSNALERNKYIVNDVNAEFCLVQKDLADNFFHKHFVIEDLVSASGVSSAIAPPLRLESPAYVIYTSGSTGKPKGVLLSHRSASTGVLCALPTDQRGVRNLLFYNPVFSASTRTILSTLCHGGTLCLASKASLTSNLAHTVNSMRVNTLGITSSTVPLLGSPADVPSLTKMTVTGELIDPSLLETWCTPTLEVYNNYGLSECTQLSFGRRLYPGSNPRNVGMPSDTTIAYVLQPGTTRLSPFYVPGELCLEGPQLASGYVGREDLTDKVFVESPFGEGFIYRTGDMAMRLPDGSVEIVGRIDFQVKINGQRVEPGEVSSVLRAHGDVISAVVVAASVDGKKVLVACVVSEAADWSRLVGELRTLCMSNLPVYMVPSYFVSYASLPVNGNGKTDVARIRREIESMDKVELLGVQTSSDDDMNDTEKSVQTVWAEVLKLPVEVISATSSFLELGGDSLAAIRVAALLLDQHHLKANIGDIIRAESLRDVAAGLELATAEDNELPQPFSLLPANYASIDKGLYEDAFPATPLQEGVIFSQISSGSYVYHRVFQISEGVDMVKLRSAFEEVVAANPIYRTTFLEDGNSFLNVVVKDFSLPWSTVANTSVSDYQAQLGSFDLGKPFVRVAELDNRTLVISMHHALFDYWSSKFLFTDVSASYLSKQVVDRPAFNTFVAHQLRKSSDKVNESFWPEYLREAQPTILSTLAAPFTATKLFVHSEICDLRAISAATGVTVGAIAYAAWALVLWRQTRGTDIMFAITLSGRDAPLRNVADLNGPTLTTVPMRVNVEPDMTLLEFVKTVQENLWKVADASSYGMRKALTHAGGAGFDTMVNFLIKSEEDADMKQIFKAPTERPAWETGYNTLEIEEGDGGFELRFSGEMEAKRAKFILDQVERVFEGLAGEESAKPLAELDVIGFAEKRCLAGLSPELSDYVPQMLHRPFEEMAATQGHRVAIQFDDVEVTYAQLNEKANQLALFLIQNGIRADSLVPICLDKSVEMLVAILGILKAGGGYVPLDAHNPPERNNFIVTDVEATIVLTDSNYAPIFDEQIALGVNVLDIYELELESYSGITNPVTAATPSNLAYAIYTSGSTGTPKGVLIQHSAISAGIASICHAESFSSSWRNLQFSNYVFDVSVGDFFCTFSVGATLCMTSTENMLSDLAGVVNKMGVTRLFLTPTVAKLIQPADVPNVEGIYLAGEPVTADLVNAWAPRCTVMNCYGPTEASILACAGPLPAGSNPKVIGYPLLNVRATILDRDGLDLVPYGAVGELCLAGPQLARGYLKRPDVTAAAFVDRNGERTYRTGDLARWLPDGRVECFGRKDSQVKVNGHRIELGEIESAILGSGLVLDTAVVIANIGGKVQLVAYAVLAAGEPVIDKDPHSEEFMALSLSLVGRLPPYMVPNTWMPVGALPLMPSGKSDRRKLVGWVQDMDVLELSNYTTGDTGSGEMVEPETEQEALLQSLWASLFAIEAQSISATSPFFKFGGDSISAINLVSKCRAAGYILAVADVMAFPVLRDMAGRLKSMSKATETKVEVPTYTLDADTSDILAAYGVRPEDIETVYPAVPGVADFLDRGAEHEQYWQCQTVRTVPADFDFDTWCALTTQLTANNEILRSMWAHEPEQDRWMQIVLAKPVLDVETLYPASEAEKERLIDEEWNTHFTLGDKPFVRYRLIVLPDGARELYIKIHHAMYDGTLLRIFDDEFTALARGSTVPKNVGFADYVHYMHSRPTDSSAAFWKDLLKESPAPFPAVNHPTSSGMLLGTTDGRVDAFASACGVTVPIVFQTAFGILLSKLSSSTDVVFDNLITGRNVDMEDAQTIAGTCATFLPFRSRFDSSTSVRDFLKSTQSLFWSCSENGNVTYSSLGLKSTSLFLFQPFEPAKGGEARSSMRWMVMAGSRVRMPIDYALHLEVSKGIVGYKIKWRYDGSVYSSEQIEDINKMLDGILEGMMSGSRGLVEALVR